MCFTLLCLLQTSTAERRKTHRFFLSPTLSAGVSWGFTKSAYEVPLRENRSLHKVPDVAGCYYCVTVMSPCPDSSQVAHCYCLRPPHGSH